MPFMVMLRPLATVRLNTRRPLWASVRLRRRVRGLSNTTVFSTMRLIRGTCPGAEPAPKRVPTMISRGSRRSLSTMATTSLTWCWPSASNVTKICAPG
ncbi:Uncharacterised protein [Mycobacteroides abscessus subsp. abscessus]|nr:Uncharacterised protein [Mycobacteroides abscessus subsp. abscessus]